MATLALKAVIVSYVRSQSLCSSSQLSIPIEEEIKRNQHLNVGKIGQELKGDVLSCNTWSQDLVYQFLQGERREDIKVTAHVVQLMNLISVSPLEMSYHYSFIPNSEFTAFNFFTLMFEKTSHLIIII